MLFRSGFENAYFVNGTAYAGKSTLVKGLAQKHGDVVKNFEEATGVKIPYEIKERRPGDVAECYCSAALAKKELDWEAQFDIRRMCEDSWRWQKNNPNGYE